jgi:hypothetical protein
VLQSKAQQVFPPRKINKTAPASKKATNRNCQGMLKVIQHALMVAKLGINGN